MSPPTAHMPSGAELGGPIMVPVLLVTIPLSNKGAKMTAKEFGACPFTLLSQLNFTIMNGRFAVRV